MSDKYCWLLLDQLAVHLNAIVEHDWGHIERKEKAFSVVVSVSIVVGEKL